MGIEFDKVFNVLNYLIVDIIFDSERVCEVGIKFYKVIWVLIVLFIFLLLLVYVCL